MNIQAFLEVVPRWFKRVAVVVVVCAVVAATVAAVLNRLQMPFFVPIGIGLMFVVFAPAWILSLGFVYADAQRRSMPAWLWTLIAAFIPNLLGFLLYFACRRPIAVPCPHCGQANTPGHRFCSWCGQLAAGPLASEGKLA